MSATTPDEPRGPSAGRRRRAQLVLVASALVVVAAAVGTSLAIATRPVERPAAADVPGSSAGQTAVADQQVTVTREPAAAGSTQAPAAGSTQAPAASGALALDDGDHDAYVTSVDAANHRIVVDVVQVFHDKDAVREAVADGKSPAEAKYLTTWVRNQNPRLRTLPLAGDVQVRLRDTCGEGGGDRDARLTRLAANARLNGTYYYTLTVDDGTVERIQERLAVNAC
jgi:hypothetical protein